ncbi:MAG: VCBS repeat-containing protein, partial [Bacteroidota bacterium]
MLTLHAPESTGIHFSNTLYPSTELNVITFEYFYNGAGVAIGDINKDGLQDLYFSGNMVPGRLYVNKGNFSFEDVTKASGIDTTGKWGTGVAMVDINADGFLDLYLCFSGPYGPEQRKNQLYINNGNSTFTEMAEKYGLDDDSHTTQAAFLDYDLDGDLDLYLLNNMTDRTGPNVIRPKRNNGEMINTDKLYRNDGNRFTDVSEEAGIRKEGYGLGIAIGDIDQDGYPDIYVSNDYLSNDLLYLNNGNGTFTDRAEEFLKHTSYSSMGCDMADYNNDGLLDIVALDMLPPDQRRRMEMIGSINHKRFQSELDNGYAPQFMRNSLQLNRGKLSGGQLPFSEIGQYAGIESTDWSWSPILADMDNDGLKDLLVTNGYPKDITNLDFASYKANSIMKGFFNNAVLADLVKEMEKTTGAYLPNFGYKNLGNLAFGNVSREWGFTQNSFSHGAAIADLDNDGDLDYVVNNSYDSIFIYENTLPKTAQHNYLRLKFKGASLNPEGWGTKIWMYQDTLVQYQEYYPVRGYQSTMEPFVHFGLGGRKVDSVVVEWSDRVTHILHEPDSDQVLTLGYPTSDTDVYKESKTRTPTLFEEVALVDFKHAETYFSDFEQLPLLLQGYAQSGPGLCVWDVNGDGHDDFYIGGARGQAGALFKGLGDGRFKRLPLDLDTESEDLDAVFFDADNDGDKDLYVCSGSTEFPSGSDYYTDRLYTN